MNEDKGQQNNEERSLHNVLSFLATSPKPDEIEHGFSELLPAVTDLQKKRIPYASSTKTSFISLLYMTKLQKIIGVSAALVVVLAVGYFTLLRNTTTSNEDIANAVVDDPSSYQVADNQDSFGDLSEQDPAATSSILGGASQSTSVPASPSSIDTTLADLDALFASDDISDTDLQTWSDDTSAGDTLTQDYNI